MLRAILGLALLASLATAGCANPFEEAGCTLDVRSHPVEVARDVPFPFVDAAKLRVEACATREGQTPTCTESAATKEGERFVLGGSLEAISGSLTRADDGNTRLLLTVHVGEGETSTTTQLLVRVLDDADREITKAEGAVRWSDDECHPAPNTSKI